MTVNKRSPRARYVKDFVSLNKCDLLVPVYTHTFFLFFFFKVINVGYLSLCFLCKSHSSPPKKIIFTMSWYPLNYRFHKMLRDKL